MQNSYTNKVVLITFMTAVSVGLTCTVLGADNYSALAAQGYRWVTVNGPYACNTEQGVERIFCSPYRCDRTPSGGEHPVLLPHTGNYRSG
jgi:hypothetical protein